MMANTRKASLCCSSIHDCKRQCALKVHEVLDLDVSQEAAQQPRPLENKIQLTRLNTDYTQTQEHSKAIEHSNMRNRIHA